VITEEGIEGISYNGDEEDLEVIDAAIHREIKPNLIGKDILRFEVCREAMMPVTKNIRRGRRLSLVAMACVESALWDAFGKFVGLPLFKIWGGYRTELPIIAIAGYYEEGKTLADCGREMECLRKMGLAGCKFKVGGRSPEEDVRRVKEARVGGGDDFILMVDANQGWSAAEAVTFARLAEPLNLRWFEEPCRWWNDHLDMAMVRTRTSIPICAGQSELGFAGCRSLMMCHAIDICNFDGSWSGGPGEWLKVAKLAECFGVQMAHHEEPQISAHLLAAVPNGTHVECFHPDREPLFWELIANRPALDNGVYKVPDGAGWGIELDQKVIEKYRVG
jgi:D-arabinonate dehydratase